MITNVRLKNRRLVRGFIARSVRGFMARGIRYLLDLRGLTRGVFAGSLRGMFAGARRADVVHSVVNLQGCRGADRMVGADLVAVVLGRAGREQSDAHRALECLLGNGPSTPRTG